SSPGESWSATGDWPSGAPSRAIVASPGTTLTRTSCFNGAGAGAGASTGAGGAATFAGAADPTDGAGGTATVGERPLAFLARTATPPTPMHVASTAMPATSGHCLFGSAMDAGSVSASASGEWK